MAEPARKLNPDDMPQIPEKPGKVLNFPGKGATNPNVDGISPRAGNASSGAGAPVLNLDDYRNKNNEAINTEPDQADADSHSAPDENDDNQNDGSRLEDNEPEKDHDPENDSLDNYNESYGDDGKPSEGDEPEESAESPEEDEGEPETDAPEAEGEGGEDAEKPGSKGPEAGAGGEAAEAAEAARAAEASAAIAGEAAGAAASTGEVVAASASVGIWAIIIIVILILLVLVGALIAYLMGGSSGGTMVGSIPVGCGTKYGQPSTAQAKAIYGGSESEVQSQITSVRLVNGSTAQFHKIAAPCLEGAMKEIESTNALGSYRLVYAGSFNWRPIAGSSTLSLHSFGIAIDFNPSTNPYCRVVGSRYVPIGPYPACYNYTPPEIPTDFPSEFVAIMKKYGFKWGGEFRTKKDAMHFQWEGAPLK